MTVLELAALQARERLEHDVQGEVVSWLRIALDPRVAWSAVDKGVKLSGDVVERAKAAAALRRRGVENGLADLRFVLVGGRSAEIELKRPVGSRVSEDQKEWRRRVEGAGGLYAMARSVDEVRAILIGWGVELRERG
jgi:hypothetical protein